MNVLKLHKDAKLPEYKTEGSVGMDFYTIKEETIFPGETKVIKLGIALEIPEGYEITIRGRSGLSTNSNYLCKTGTIDWDYRGEIGVIIHNPNNCGIPLNIKKGMRIAQGVMQKVFKPEITEISDLSFTKRNGNGFGSTGE